MRKTPRERVLDAVEGGVRTWDELQALTRLGDEALGLALGELLDARVFWTGERDGVRFYGPRRGTTTRLPQPKHGGGLQ